MVILKRVSVVEGRCIASLSMDKQEHLLALCSVSGDILLLDSSTLESKILLQTESTPVGMAIDQNTDDVFLTNRVEQCIMCGKLPSISSLAVPDRRDSGNTANGRDSLFSLSATPCLTRFEGRSFIGPTCLAISPVDGEVFFTDGGCEGDTSLINPSGAIYRTVQGRKHVSSLFSHGLQRPTGMAFNVDGCLFVCEQSANRLIRLVPRGGYYSSAVFVQFSGSLGPSAIAISRSRQRIYVALYESLTVVSKNILDENNVLIGAKPPSGRIVTLNMRGEVIEELETPEGPQLTALCIDSSDRLLYAVHADEQQPSSKIYCFELLSGL